MNLLSGLFDKEGMIKSTIENFLERVAEQHQLQPTDLFVMIKPIRDQFGDDDKDENFKIWIYENHKWQAPKLLRESSIAEIISEDED